MAMRLAHLSDLHFHVPATLRQAMSKRVLGLANLYIKGRVRQFSGELARQAIAAVIAQRPDAVVITGDLTALATPEEFALAREALDPLLTQVPTIIIPGNHDTYTRGAVRSRRIEAHFGAWLAGQGGGGGEGLPVQFPTSHQVGHVRLVGLNPCRASVGSSGLLDAAELERLRGQLAAPREEGEFRVLLIHYPLLSWKGQPVTKWTRRLNGRAALLDILHEHPVELILHGHDHLRYYNHLPLPGGEHIYVANAGSAAFTPGREVPIGASFNVYEIEGRRLSRVQHFDGDNGAFRLTYEGPPPAPGPVFRTSGAVPGVGYV